MVLTIVIFTILGVANSAHLTKGGSHRGHDVAVDHQNHVRRNGGRQPQGKNAPNFEIIHMDISNLKPLPPLDPDLNAKRKIQENLNGQGQPQQFRRRNGNQMRQRAQRRMQRRRQQQRRRQNQRRRNRLMNARRQQASMNQQQRNQNQGMQMSNQAMQVPNQGMQIPNQGIQVPNQAIQVPNQGIQVPNQGIQVPNQGMQVPNQGIQVPNQGMQVPNQGMQVPNQGMQVPNQVMQVPNQQIMQPAMNMGNPLQQHKNIINLLKPSFPVKNMVPQPMIMNQIPNTNNMVIPNIQQLPPMQNKPVMQQAMPLNPQGIPNAMNAAINPVANNMMMMPGNQMIQPRNPVGNPLPIGIVNGIGGNRNIVAPNNQIPIPALPQIPSLNLNMNGKGQNQLNQQVNNAIQSAVKNDQAGPKTHTINLQITRKKIVPDNGPAPVHPPLLPKHMINRRPENPKHAKANLASLVAQQNQPIPQPLQTAALKNLISKAAKPQIPSGKGRLTSLLSSSLMKPASNPKDFTQGRLEQNLLIPASALVNTKQNSVVQKVPTVSVLKTNTQLTNSPIQIAGALKKEKVQKAISIPIDTKAAKVIHVTTSNKGNTTGLTSLLTSNGSHIPFNVTTTKKNGKMEIMLMSKYTGNRPIVIEAGAGNILLSHVKSPNGQTQFIIKHEKPTTTVSASQTTDIPTTTITEEPGEFEAEDYPTTTVPTTVANTGSASKA